MDSFPHLPVLADPVRQAFADLPATLGGGAHSALLLADAPALQLIGLDQDPAAPPLLRALAPLAGGGGRNGAGGGNR